MFQGYFKGGFRVIEGCFKGVSWAFLGCFMVVSRLFAKSLFCFMIKAKTHAKEKHFE